VSTAVATERVPLSFLLAQNAGEDPPVEPILPFAAWRALEATGFGPERWLPITVTGLMERTAAFHALDNRYDTGVLKFDLVMVEPAEVRWQTARGPRNLENGQAQKSGKHWRSYPHTTAAPEDQRAKSDQRAIANRAEVQRAQQLERHTYKLAAQHVSTSIRLKADEAEGEPMKPRISQERREELKAQGLRHCSHCDQDKPLDQFRSNGYCKSCGVEYDRNRSKGTKPAKAVRKARKSQPAIPAESATNSAPGATTIVTVIKEGAAMPLPTNGHAPSLQETVLAAFVELEQLREFKRRVLELASA